MPLIINTSPIFSPIHQGDETKNEARHSYQAHAINFNIRH